MNKLMVVCLCMAMEEAVAKMMATVIVKIIAMVVVSCGADGTCNDVR